ncbi:hypothetical protein RHSIM_Rhsim10G0075500 [Rhododendron simsii]|uniref:Uncharacterized protein n=1 Tax=Rhododendron simsii TaxID=118357 RepID=A0A834LBP4_RHOSS|nr:hypothetical protein RHSIM_Rhsim10G0075500 [Rhododendron simsii]
MIEISRALTLVEAKLTSEGVMEEALLLKNGDRKLVLIAPEAFVEDLKKVTAIAAPMVVVTMSQPRPYSFNGSWQICNLANSLAISLHYSGISGSVLANSDIDMYFILVTN